MKRKGKILVPIILVLILAISYFSYHGYFLHKYWLDAKWIATNQKIHPNIGKTIRIKEEPLKQEEYQNFYGVKMDKILENFQLIDSSGTTKDGYARYGLEEKEFFSITIYPSIAKNFEKISSSKITSREIKDVLKKYKIETLSDQIQFLKTYSYSQNHIFMTPEEMRENYIIQTYLITVLPTANNEITLIEGAKSGYSYSYQENKKNYKVVCIDDGKTIYNFLFQKSAFFTEEVIQHLIGTATFS